MKSSINSTEVSLKHGATIHYTYDVALFQESYLKNLLEQQFMDSRKNRSSFNQSPGEEFLTKRTVSTDIQVQRPTICRNYIHRKFPRQVIGRKSPPFLQCWQLPLYFALISRKPIFKNVSVEPTMIHCDISHC